MIKIAVLGAGHLGKIHIKLLLQNSNFDLVGFFDPDDATAQEVEKQYGVKRFLDLDKLMTACDAVDIVTPTLHHFNCAVKAIQKGKHIFIEKPLSHTLKEATQLVKLVEQSGLKAQVGHVERFNPAFLAIAEEKLSPLFIESHRLAQFNPRGTDVSVVLDLMIHDLDIILSLVKSPVKKVSANGVSVLSNSPDIANARIEFENGCVANVTASRLSVKNMRKTRVFQKDAYVSIDFLAKETEFISLKDNVDDNPIHFPINLGEADKQKYIVFKKAETKEVNAIEMELQLFSESIKFNKEEAVTIQDGFRAMELAHNILDEIKKNQSIPALANSPFMDVPN